MTKTNPAIDPSTFMGARLVAGNRHAKALDVKRIRLSDRPATANPHNPSNVATQRPSG
jgi:hypothetical protein